VEYIYTTVDMMAAVQLNTVNRCVRCSQTIDLQAICRRYTRTCNDFARASACIDEMPCLYLLEMPSLYRGTVTRPPRPPAGLTTKDVD
jgi:hypothetical protein